MPFVVKGFVFSTCTCLKLLMIVGLLLARQFVIFRVFTICGRFTCLSFESCLPISLKERFLSKKNYGSRICLFGFVIKLAPLLNLLWQCYMWFI